MRLPVLPLCACALIPASMEAGTTHCQRQKILAFDGGFIDVFGNDAANDNEWAVVAARHNDVEGSNDGAAYVFHREETEWVSGQKLIPSSGPDGLGFAWQLCMTGDTVAVGAKSAHTTMGDFTGAVYVFEEQSGIWTETQEIVAPDGSFADEFGDAVAMDRDRLIVGAFNHDGMANGAGSAYIFRRDTTESWVFEDQLFALNAHSGGAFGDNVAIDGDWAAVVGSNYGTESNGADLYLFQYDNVMERWVERQRFSIENVYQHLLNERALSMDNGLLVFGVSPDSSAHIFRLADGEWQLEQLIDWDGDLFGYSTAVNGERIFVTAPLDDENGENAGAVHIFEHNGIEWELAVTAYHSDGTESGDGLGASIAVDHDTIIAGASGDNQLGADAGAAFVFDLECGECATLDSISVAFGSRISGALQHILESDDSFFRARSRPGFTHAGAHLIDLRIAATSADLTAPDTIDLIVEGRLNTLNGVVQARLRDWTMGQNGTFQTVHAYGLGTQEKTEFIENVPDAAKYIRAADNRVELSLRQSAFATFSVQGFDSFLDFVSIEVEE